MTPHQEEKIEEHRKHRTNSALWDRLGKTDPDHTKPFTRAGGFRGTAIKPMWSYKRMTEEFGPCGTGWGIHEPKFELVHAGDEVLVYCTVSVWYAKANTAKDATDPDSHSLVRSNTVYGVGGDKVFSKGRTDDEAFKKAYTDAVTNALKMIGVGADVHMGMFDDNKYVNSLQREFAEQDEPTYIEKSSAALKKAGTWEKLTEELEQDMVDVRSLVALERVKVIYRQRAKEEGWNAAFKAQLKDRFESYEDRIKAENPADAVDDIQDTFPGARVVDERIGHAPAALADKLRELTRNHPLNAG